MERAVSGRSDDERSKRTAPQRRVHRRALAGRRAHLDEGGASGEVVVEGAFAERSRGASVRLVCGEGRRVERVVVDT